jgi:hypothetical protein
MKGWHVFSVGVAGLVAAFLYGLLEPFVAALISVLVIGAVVLGFLWQPRPDMLHVDTVVVRRQPDHKLVLEHDLLAVRVELARLWLLFLPTVTAVAFLVVTSALGNTWEFRFPEGELGYLAIYPGEWLIFGVIWLLSIWLSERWMLRQARAVTARYVSSDRRSVRYTFVDEQGSYYGGWAVSWGPSYPRALTGLVLYRSGSPEHNRIARGMLFHRVVVIGHGLTDLDAETVSRGRLPRRIQAKPQPS